MASTHVRVKNYVKQVMDKLPALMKKHGIKSVGSWHIEPTEHLFIYVYEAPTLDAFQKFIMEPELMKWIAGQTSEVKVAMTTEEIMKLLK